MSVTWWAVLSVGALSYLLRLVPWLVLARIEVSSTADAVLRYAGVGAVTALLVGSVLTTAGGSASGAPVLGLAAALGGAAWLSWRGLPSLLVVAVGMTAFAAVTWLW